MKIFDFFRKKQKPEPQIEVFDGPTTFYHEDDYLQIEIIVNENIEKVDLESNKINTFSEEQFDGIGFKDLYIRTDDNKIELSDRKITITDFENILISLNFEKINYVLTGYGNSYKSLHKNCFAFSKSETIIFYEFKNNIIQNIWFDINLKEIDKNLINFFLQIGQAWNLSLQDWNQSITIDLQNKIEIENYLKYDVN
ncbi:MAG: hypothetical protein RLZZ175_903 [Bacteroidota bacterium]|jgi:hypothetical protein